MKLDITRAWKDESYRQSLSAEQLSALPVNPAGELSEIELTGIAGGWDDHGLFAFVRNESTAFICEVNLFSKNIANHILLATFTSVCAKG